jgi:hypothetical protein
MKNLNFKFILFYLVAVWIFIHAFATAALLYDVKLVQGFINEGKSYLNNLSINALRISCFSICQDLGKLLGLVFSVCVSVILARKNKIGWLNILPIFVVGYFFVYFDFLSFGYLKIIFLSPGDSLTIVSVKLIITSVSLLLLGMAIFWFTPVNNKAKTVYDSPEFGVNTCD